MNDRLKDVNDALGRLKAETGAECLKLLEFFKIKADSADDIFLTSLTCGSSVKISGAEIDLQDRLKEIVKHRLMNSLRDMIELLENDLEKLMGEVTI
jgi:hypothetical protein